MKIITRFICISTLLCSSWLSVANSSTAATNAAMQRDMIAGATIFAVGDVAAQLLTAKRTSAVVTREKAAAASTELETTKVHMDKHRLSSAAILGCVWSGICVPAVYSFVESLFPGRTLKRIIVKMMITCSILSTIGNYFTMLARRLMMQMSKRKGERASVGACIQRCNGDIHEVIMDDLKIWPLYDIACYSIVPPSLRPITTAVMSSLWATYMSVASANDSSKQTHH